MAVRLRLLTWNLHATPVSGEREARLERAARALLERADGERPDLVLLQEVWGRDDERRLSRRLERLYEPAGVPENLFPGRKGGLLGFVRRASGWRIEANRFHEFRAEAGDWKFWQGDGIGDKGVQRLDIRRADLPLVVLNTHLQSEYGRRQRYYDVRSRQLQEMRDLVSDVDGRVPILGAGDLNLRTKGPNYPELTEFWLDLTRGERERCRCGTHVHSTGRDRGWIDYVFARPGPHWQVEAEAFRYIRSRFPDDPYSDHHALEADVVLRPTRSAGLALRALAAQQVWGPATRRHWLLALGLLAAPRWVPDEGAAQNPGSAF